MRKIRLASQDRSKHCSHSLCPFPCVIEVIFGSESRRLCQLHYNQCAAKNLYPDNTPVFIKASEL